MQFTQLPNLLTKRQLLKLNWVNIELLLLNTICLVIGVAITMITTTSKHAQMEQHWLIANAPPGGMAAMVPCLTETAANLGVTGRMLLLLLLTHALRVTGNSSNTRVESSGEMMTMKNIPAHKVPFWLVAHATLGGLNVMEPCLMVTLAESTTDGVTNIPL